MATQKKVLKLDLCPKKPDPKLMDVGETMVEVTVTLETKQPVPSSKFDRCVGAAETVLERYQSIIQDEVLKLEAKVKAAAAKGEVDEVLKMARDTTTSVQGACRAIQGAVDKAVEDRIKKEAQGDQNLLEARIITGVKITFKVISIAKDVTEVVVTAGANVKAWVSLAKDIASLAMIIYDLTKGEEKLRAELLDAIGAYSTDKQRRVIEEEKAATSRKAKFVFIAKEFYRKVKPLSDKTEAARKKYRNEVTSMRQHVDKLFSKIEALEKEVKKAKTLKEGVALGAKMMEMKRNGKLVQGEFSKAEGFADDMAYLMTEAGVGVDDRTIIQKIATFNGLKDMAKGANEIRSAATDLKDMVENIVKLAA